MSIGNEVRLEMTACSQNERFARLAAAGFLVDLNPTLMEMEDVKTAVSEAVTNAIIHGYNVIEDSAGQCLSEEDSIKQFSDQCAAASEDENPVYPKVVMILRKEGRDITVIVEDYGKGIEDVDKAMEPMYTTRPEWERSGMGFAFMEAFMDSLKVESKPGHGTRVTMKKSLCAESNPV